MVQLFETKKVTTVKEVGIIGPLIKQGQYYEMEGTLVGHTWGGYRGNIDLSVRKTADTSDLSLIELVRYFPTAKGGDFQDGLLAEFILHWVEKSGIEYTVHLFHNSDLPDELKEFFFSGTGEELENYF